MPRIDPIHTGGRIAEKQDRGRSEKACCSQSETLLYHLHLSRSDIPMPRAWKSDAGPNWTDYPNPHPYGQPNLKSSSSNKLWSSYDTMDEQQQTNKVRVLFICERYILSKSQWQHNMHAFPSTRNPLAPSRSHSILTL